MNQRFLKPFPDDVQPFLGARQEPLPLVPPTGDRTQLEQLQSLATQSIWQQRSQVDSQMASAALSGLWLWHGFLEQAHELCQDIPTAEGSYWHGIMHRIEGDFWNAKYWMRRAGRHPVHSQILSDISHLSLPITSSTVTEVLKKSDWDAEDFVDACERSIDGSHEEQTLACRWIQTVEWRCLMLYCLACCQPNA